MESKIHRVSPTWTVFALVGGFVMTPLAALAQDARPVRAQSIRQRPMLPNRAPAMKLPQSIARLPSELGVALYAPRLDALWYHAQELVYVGALVLPQLTDRSVVELLTRQLWGEPTETGSSWISALASPQSLHRLGIDPTKNLLFVPHPSAPVGLVSIGLSDRPRFERWLNEIGGRDRTRISLFGEQASVLGQDRDMPVTCLARRDRAYCQVGVSPGDDALATLKRWLDPKTRPTAQQVAGLQRAYRHMHPSSDAFVFVRSEALVPWFERLVLPHFDRVHRFQSRTARQEASLRKKAWRKQTERAARLTDGLVLSIDRRGRKTHLQTEIALSSWGRKTMTEWFPARSNDDVVARWADTPAIFRLLLRMNPDLLRSVASMLDVPMPSGGLTGQLALLTLGLDSECPMAKAEAASAYDGELGWAFVLPTAAAVGVRDRAAADAVYARLRESPALEPIRSKSYERRGLPIIRPPLMGRVADAAYELEVFDDVMLVGAGPGSRTAAIRRLGLSHQRTRPTFGRRAALAPRSPHARPVLEANLDLHAANAALASGSFREEHRAELLRLEAVRLALAPLLRSIRWIDMRASLAEKDRFSIAAIARP